MHQPIEQVGKWLHLGFSVGAVRITIGSVLGAVLIVVAFVVFSMLLRRVLRRYGSHHGKFSNSSLYTVERLLHYVLLVIGILLALSFAGVPMSQMVVFAGALGVGLGFGLQAIFSNFISGLVLLFDRSLKIDDFVELQSGVCGHVREIRIRCTRISTNDGLDILVPNSEFVTKRVANWTLGGKERRLHVDFRVALDTDAQAVQAAGREAAAAVPFTQTDEGQRAPMVWLDAFGESALECQLIVWLDADATLRPGAAEAAYKWALLDALDRRGIVIPYAQRTVRVVPRTGAGGDNEPRVATALTGRNDLDSTSTPGRDGLSAAANAKKQDQ